MMKQKIMRCLMSGAFAVMLLSFTSVNAVVYIDNFLDAAVFEVNAGSHCEHTTETAATNMVGLDRDILVEIIDNPFNQEVQTFAGAGGLLLLNSLGYGVEANLHLIWDSNGGDCVLQEEGITPKENIVLAGETLQLGVASDQTADIVIKIYTDATHWSEYTFTVNHSATLITYEKVLSDTSDIGGDGPANFTMVGAVELLVVDAPSALDLALNFIEGTPDTTFCEMTNVGTNAFGEKFIEMTVQDTGSGLASINILQDLNATVTGNVAGTDFTVGTNDAVIVTGTKIIQSQGSIVELEVTDVAGNVITCDPVITTVVRENGQPVSETYTNIPEAESNITVENGDPGLKNLEIIVNGDKYKVTGLKDGDVLTLDVSPSMVEGYNNTMVLTARGKPGTSALVVISD